MSFSLTWHIHCVSSTPQRVTAQHHPPALGCGSHKVHHLGFSLRRHLPFSFWECKCWASSGGTAPFTTAAAQEARSSGIFQLTVKKAGVRAGHSCPAHSSNEHLFLLELFIELVTLLSHQNGIWDLLPWFFFASSLPNFAWLLLYLRQLLPVPLLHVSAKTFPSWGTWPDTMGQPWLSGCQTPFQTHKGLVVSGISY